jgi:signal transduction histidine kinase
LGLAPAIVSASSSLHGDFHRWGAGTGFLSQIARNIAQASHSSGSLGQVVVDYLFSAFNIALGLILLRLRPRDRTARLLSLGMVGTAVAFNLQGHDALQVLPVASLPGVEAWHEIVHLASGFCYTLALLTFPDGRFARPRSALVAHLRVPVLVVVGFVLMILSFVSVDDHTLGLVVLFGIVIPIAGIASQLGRYVGAENQEKKQQSRVLLTALGISVVAALPIMFFTSRPGGPQPSATQTYEVADLQPGTYLFRCDPHPEDMTGTLVVAADAEAASVDLSSVSSKFSKDRITLAAGEINTISFTNFDSDLHNVAIYRDDSATDPVFIGQEFSGQQSAIIAFRGFRIIFAVIPIGLFVGLVRFRLWDVNRILNRTLVYGALAGMITLVYLAIVVGIGAAIGASYRTNIVLSIATTAVVALAFQPLRARARRVANRLVYGERATPYEVLSEFSSRAGDTLHVEEILPRMARTIGEGTGARRAEVWLRVGDELQRTGLWPEEAGPEEGGPAAPHLRLQGTEIPAIQDVDHVIPVKHQGETLGALAVAMPPGHTITPIERRLLDDAAAQAGLVLRNVQLTAELRGSNRDLKASRQRILSAQDAERRRLERDIHDGAQQHLIALSMRMREAEDAMVNDPEKARALMAELRDEAGVALDTLRDLARGIYPPVLADKGLKQALDAHARRTSAVVTIVGQDVGRANSEIEAAVYFCCLEAIQNAVKHAPGSPVMVTLHREERRLTFTVSDRGPGFREGDNPGGAGLHNMRDRMATVGGELVVRGRNDGTSVTGSVLFAPAQGAYPAGM